jgi:hypothetical protein
MASRRYVVTMAMLGLVGCDPQDRPDVCGYRCGPSAACPSNYSCHADGRCHLNGAPEFGCTLDGGPDSVPEIVSSYPGDEATEVPVTAAIQIVFDESVVGVNDQTVRLIRRAERLPIAATVVYDDREHAATLTPVTNLEEGETYIIRVDPRIRDTSGNAFAGENWHFTTVTDKIPPRISTIAPLDGATNVGIDTPVIVTFSEHVYGVYADNFTVKGPDGASAGHFADASGTFARIDGPWAPHTTYTVELSGISPVIIDRGSNPLVGVPLAWSFTTGADTVPPQIVSRSPEIGATNYLLDVVSLRFSETMIGASTASVTLDHDGTAVTTTVTYNDLHHELKVLPVGGLAPLTIYRVSVHPTLTDTAGNPIVPGVLSWTFETGAQQQ